MSAWTKAGENLVRHWSGTIYLRAKVAGKPIRVSLGTADLRIAKIKRDDRLENLRKAAKTKSHTGIIRTLGDAIEALAVRVLSQPHLKAPTVGYYGEMLDILRESLPTGTHGRQWTAGDAAAWWKKLAKKYSAQRANNALGMVKRLGKLLVEAGVRTDDPTILLRRVRIVSREMAIPSRDKIEQVITNIRGQHKAHSEQAANYVTFLAFSGCRSSQAKAFEWKHVEADWIRFPAGVTGSKGADSRKLPISPPLRRLLDSMRPEKPIGPLFTMKRPHESLKNACVRLGIPHLRVHDLRHFFASFAIEQGVDVPTVARWLGHKDGGALVLRTYGHVRDEHSLASAAKLA